MISTTLLALTLFAGEPDEAELKKRAVELVAQLGDKDYRDREKAAKDLLEMGYAAKEAVLAGQKNADREISERCLKLYPAIWRHDLNKRVQKFLDNADGPIGDDLPGAARWVKTAGDGKESRELYGVMVKEHSELLLNVELHPERLRDVYVEFMKATYTKAAVRPGTPTTTARQANDAEVLVFLFLGSTGDPRPTGTLGVSSSYYYQFMNTPFLAGKLSSTTGSPAVRKLFAAWLERERYTIAMRRGLDLAAQNGVRECAATALKIATDVRTTPALRSTAMLGFAKIASKGEIKDLEPFLNDKQPVVNLATQGSVQIRDVALGAAVMLAGQNLSDFGFERKPPAGLVSISTYTYFSFTNDEKRDAAHAKWKEWAKKNLEK